MYSTCLSRLRESLLGDDELQLLLYKVDHQNMPLNYEFHKENKKNMMQNIVIKRVKNIGNYVFLLYAYLVTTYFSFLLFHSECKCLPFLP